VEGQLGLGILKFAYWGLLMPEVALVGPAIPKLSACQAIPKLSECQAMLQPSFENPIWGGLLCRTMARANHKRVEEAVLEGCLGDAAKLQQMPPQAPRSRRRLTASWWK